jgi:uncharacterized protein
MLTYTNIQISIGLKGKTNFQASFMIDSLMLPTYQSVIDDVVSRLADKSSDPHTLGVMFRQCFLNTLETTVQQLSDDSTFVITGDIPAMWLRDSSAQVQHYLPLAATHPDIRLMLRGLILRQSECIGLDPYANAFNREPNRNGHNHDLSASSPWVWERKFELDSLCYPVALLYRYWQATNDHTVFNERVYVMLRRIVETLRTEQQHDALSPYRFERPKEHLYLPSDTLPFKGKGTRSNFTGMVWSGFRPSDDACKFGYLIPANMFAVVILGYLAEMSRAHYHDSWLVAEAKALREDIEFGINTYGIVQHPQFGAIYAYETDGYGNYNLMDDANVPSLLSIPYLGYRPVTDVLYQNTRRFILSSANPYYFTGKYARGIGSPHIPGRMIWPISLIMQGLTSTDPQEKAQIVHTLITTTAGTHYMHESFDPDHPDTFTRSWFAWANSLFAEFIMTWLNEQEVH